MFDRVSKWLPLAAILMMCAAHLHAQTPTYTLPPEKLKQAQALFRTRTLLHFGGTAWGILQTILLLAFRIPPRLRDLAVRVSRSRWAQCFLFTFLLLSNMALLDLPLGLYGHHLSLAYGLSVQGWSGWSADLAKEFVLDWGPTSLGAMLLFWLIRRSPRRWWLWFWFPAMAAVFAGVFLAPILIDPLFSRFEPLAAHDPGLVARLEQVVARGPLSIPPERMFLMDASKRYTGVNAYVTGLGPSKRVVVWDTSLAAATPNQIAFIFSHEMGHYVLNHIYWTLLFLGGLTLAAFWMGFHIAGWLLRRYSHVWAIESPADWAALPVYMVVLATLSLASEPLVNGYSRMHEHIADIYGQEAMHTIAADPRATAVQTFQLLGEKALETPEPHPFIEWWTYDHPAIHTRAAFAATYDPWAPGRQPRYFSK